MKILIIPDVHGRDFWIEPCKHVDEFDKVVFLGDYHDPYPGQVSQDTSRHRLRDELVPFVEANQDKVICLFGNHDGNYLVGDMANRFDSYHRKEIKELLTRMNLQLVYAVEGYLFSHSGVLPLWVSESVDIEGEETSENILKALKNMKFSNPALMDVSPCRGGWNQAGSCVWGDVREYDASTQFKEWYQIFGHTQLREDPVITDTYACLDCRKAFVLDTETKEIKEWVEEN